MPINEEEMLAAVTAGIEEANPTQTAEEPTETETETQVEGEEAEGGEGSAETPEGESSEEAAAEEEGEPEVDAEGKPVVKAGERERNADGTFKTKEQSDAEKAAAVAKPAEKKEKDPVNDPIPEGLKKETRDRMVKLIDTTKKVTGERDAAVQVKTELLSMITSTKATPEQYGQSLDYLRMVNSGDPVEQRKALAVLQGEVAALAAMLGEPVAGVDVISQHPDLAQKVKDGAISHQDAEELAAARNSRKFAETRATQQNAATQAQTQQAQALNDGIAELNTLEATLKASDPNFAAKRAVLVPALKPVLARIHPSQWKETFLTAYNTMPVPAKAVAVPKQGSIPKNQPLRAGNPAGGQKKEPKSFAEAIDFGLAQASGR